MTQYELHKIINAAWIVNANKNDAEIDVDFGLSNTGEPCVNVYVFSQRANVGERKIVDSFSSYDDGQTIDNMVKKIMEYHKAGEAK